MNALSPITRLGSLFKSNRSQALRIPKELAFPDSLKKVYVRKEGNSLVVTPVDDFWDEFFAQGPSPDFPERAPQGEYEVREEF